MFLIKDIYNKLKRYISFRVGIYIFFGRCYICFWVGIYSIEVLGVHR